MAPTEPHPGLRFFGLLGLGLLALCAGWSAIVLGSATWAQARQLDQIFPFYTWRTPPYTFAAYENLRRSFALAGTLLAAGWVVTCLFKRNRTELKMVGQELRRTERGLWLGLQAMTSRHRYMALGAFALLTLLRLYFSIYNPEYDDAVSYEVFVSKGLLATSAFYPIPNNHVFSNTLSLLFYQFSPGFWWSMRLPVLLISTGATAFLFAALLRRAGFRVAAVAVTLFSWLQLSLYHAGVGRGYWLLIGLAGVVFFSTLELVTPGGRHRAAWAGLVLTSVLGSYTVPTFVYVLASSFSWLGLAFLRQRQWVRLGLLVTAGLLVGLGTVFLYAPLLLVSGFDKFTGNGFVAPLAPLAFWQGLPTYLWHNEGFLAGQRTLGTCITLAVLGLLGWLFYLAHRRELSSDQTVRLRQLGLPALWFMGLPYAVVVVQRVFPPERVMLYKAFFFFILAGLVVDWLLQRWPAPTYRWPRQALALLTVLFATYETYSVVRVNPGARGTNAAYHAGLQWLAAHPAGPVLIPEPTHNLFFRFYAHTEERQRPWQIDSDQQGATRYAYVVAFPSKRGFFQPLFPFAPAYHNSVVDIYIVPKDYPLVTKMWRH